MFMVEKLYNVSGSWKLSPLLSATTYFYIIVKSPDFTGQSIHTQIVKTLSLITLVTLGARENVEKGRPGTVVGILHSP